MIDWDELFEDVNWTALISLMALGLILIVLAVYIGLDWSRANSIKTKLNGNLTSIEEYNKKLAVPDNWKADLQGKIKDSSAKLKDLGVRLPEQFDQESMRAKVSDLASENGVILVSASVSGDKNETVYIKSCAFQVVFRSNDIRSVTSYYQALSKMPEPHTNSMPRLAPNIDISMEITFYSFDQETWESANNCQIDITDPVITEVDLDKVRIFKGQVEGLDNKARQERGGIENTKNSYLEYCKRMNQVERLRHEYNFIKSKWGQ